MPELVRGYQGGADERLYIGATATTALGDATADANFKYIANETSLGVAYDAEENSAVMKGLPGSKPHRAIDPGLETCELTLEGETRYADAGFALIKQARNKVWPYQVRKFANGTETVILEFLGQARQIQYENPAEGAQTFSVPVMSAGPISEPNRVVSSGS